MRHHIVAKVRGERSLITVRGRSSHWKGTTLRTNLTRHRRPSADLPFPAGSAFSPAADVIGTETRPADDGRHLVHVLTPDSATRPRSVPAGALCGVSRRTRTRAAVAPDRGAPPALRVGTTRPSDWEIAAAGRRGHRFHVPPDALRARPRRRDRRRLLDSVDPHTRGRLVGPGDSDARAGDLQRVTSFLVVPLRLRAADRLRQLHAGTGPAAVPHGRRGRRGGAGRADRRRPGQRAPVRA